MTKKHIFNANQKRQSVFLEVLLTTKLTIVAMDRMKMLKTLHVLNTNSAVLCTAAKILAGAFRTTN